MEISAEGSASTLRQVIDGKLIELGHKPRNIQVVLVMWIQNLNDSGIIAKEMEHVSSDNVVSEGHASSRDANELPRDVEMLTEQLSKVRLEIEGLHNELTNRNAKLDELHSKLEAAKQKLAAFDEMQGEVAALKKSLKQQTAKAKQLWTQKCEQLLAHEGLIEEKDAEIATFESTSEWKSVQCIRCNCRS